MLTFNKASELELEEIYELAGINRKEATGIDAENNREEMIKAYDNSRRHGAYFLEIDLS